MSTAAGSCASAAAPAAAPAAAGAGAPPQTASAAAAASPAAGDFVAGDAKAKPAAAAAESKRPHVIGVAVATFHAPQHGFDPFAEIHRLNRKVVDLQRRLRKAESKEAVERTGWAPFGFCVLNPKTTVALSNKNRTAQSSVGHGLLETIVGDCVWRAGVHSFRVRIEAGHNLFVGLAHAPDEKTRDSYPGAQDHVTKEDPSSSSARVQRPPHGQFVGESAGVGLSTQHGCVYVNGRMHYLGDYAVCKPGDDVGVHVNVDKHHVLLFRNGAALGRLIQLPAHSGPYTAAVTLVNLHDKVTLSFEHPEDQSEWPYSFDEL